MMRVYVIQKDNLDIIPNSANWDKEYCLQLIYLKDTSDLPTRFAQVHPDVILTIQASAERFPELYKSPLFVRQRWLDEPAKSKFTVHMIQECFRHALKDQAGPSVSMFTPAYKSMERIKRALRSLQRQTLKEWEWVIVDDSPDDETWRSFLVPLAKTEPRMRIWRTYQNDGDIGSVKHAAASMCRGKYLVEFDHDDEMRSEALAMIVAAFEKDPSVGMIGSDCIELYEETLADWNYGDFYGFGFHSYYKQWLDNRWVSVSRNGALNQWTIRHVVGVLNHVRVWRRTCYEEIGRHDWRLNVADDYDLIVRTFLSSKWRIAKLPRMLYLQYRALEGSNFTVQRNQFIQILTSLVQQNHEPEIHKRLLELGMPDELFKRPWHKPAKPAFDTNFFHDLTADLVLDPNPERVSVIMPTYGPHRKLLQRALKSLKNQTFPNWVVYVIGDCSPDLEQLMKDKTWLQEPRVHWWNLAERRGSGCYMRNYALKTLVTSDVVTYLDDDNWILPNHLETLYKALMNGKAKDGRKPTWAFSSFQVEEKGVVLEKRVLAKEPKLYRLDTSCVMHLRSLLVKHNRYWRPERIKDDDGNETKLAGYAVDWDLFKVWTEADEPWVATRQFTLIYNNANQDMDKIISYYDDQRDDDIVPPQDETPAETIIVPKNTTVATRVVQEIIVPIKQVQMVAQEQEDEEENDETEEPNQENPEDLMEILGSPEGCTIHIYDVNPTVGRNNTPTETNTQTQQSPSQRGTVAAKQQVKLENIAMPRTAEEDLEMDDVAQFLNGLTT